MTEERIDLQVYVVDVCLQPYEWAESARASVPCMVFC